VFLSERCLWGVELGGGRKGAEHPLKCGWCQVRK